MSDKAAVFLESLRLIATEIAPELSQQNDQRQTLARVVLPRGEFSTTCSVYRLPELASEPLIQKPVSGKPDLRLLCDELRMSRAFSERSLQYCAGSRIDASIAIHYVALLR